MFRWILVVLTFWAVPAWADLPTRVEAAFRGWVAQVGTERAVLTLWRAGQPVKDVGVGTEPDTPMPLASIGKAITGVCAATLIQNGSWTARTTARQVLGYGPGELTVEGLLTHSAGLGPDQTQGTGLLGLFQAADADLKISKRALKRKPQEGAKGKYAYNNENYAILGAMIAAQTGLSYEDYCRGSVLTPAGVRNAGPHAPIAGLLSFGGWEMPVQDFARFMHWAYGSGGIIGRRWQDWPQAEIGGGAFYGMGMTQREFRGKPNFWHFGSLCFPAQALAGSYAVSWTQDWTAVVAYDGCLTWDDMLALDAALVGAVFQ